MNNELYRDFIDRELTIIDDHLVDIINLLGNVVVLEDVTGNPVSFNTSLSMPLLQCNNLISGYQEGSGTPSPTNIRNIVSFPEGILTANNDTYTFTFGNNIYTGVIDWLNGIVKADYIVKTIDDNSGIAMSSEVGVFYWNDFFDYSNDNDSINCNCYVKDTNRTSPTNVFNNNRDLSFCCRSVDKRLYIKDTRFTSTEDYKTWLSTNPVKIAVKLATPMEIPLTPAPIKSIIGLNSIASNTGDLDIKYLALATD